VLFVVIWVCVFVVFGCFDICVVLCIWCILLFLVSLYFAFLCVLGVDGVWVGVIRLRVFWCCTIGL